MPRWQSATVARMMLLATGMSLRSRISRSGAAWLAVLALAGHGLLVGCDQKPPGTPPTLKDPPRDGSVTGRLSDDEPAGDDLGQRQERRELAELAGSWHGQASTQEYGVATAEFTVTGDGVVMFTVSGQGKTQSDRFRIESWDGKILRIRHEDDRYEIAATLSDKSLRAELPIVGSVILERR